MQPKLITLYKQAPDGLLAHVYEHIAANTIDAYMMKQGYFLISDYLVWAKTYGTTCVLELQATHRAAYKALKKAVKLFTTSTPADHEIVWAINECALEQTRKARVDLKEFRFALVALNNKPWKTHAHFIYDHASIETSVNTTYASHGLTLIKPRKNLIVEHVLNLSAGESDDPLLKVLNVVLIQTLEQNVLRALRLKTNLYDSGEEWNNGSNRLEYRHFITTTLDTASVQLRALYTQELETLKSSPQLSSSLVRLFSNYYRDPLAPYFSHLALNEITDGIIVGGAGWKQLADKSHIKDAIGGIHVSFDA